MAEVTSSTRVEKPKLTCVCCDRRTLDQGSYCQHCRAPLEVSRAVVKRGAPPQFITVLGPSGAGKTVFLGMLLDMLSKGTCPLRGLPNGPFSLALQQETVGALQHRRFPEKTPTESEYWRWIHCEVSHARKPKRIVDIVTPDLAGEAISLEIEQENTYPLIRTLVSRSAGLLVLFDSRRARDEGRDEDFFAMKLMAYLANIYGNSAAPRWRKVQVPVAIVFTKSDAVPEALQDPEAFAASTMPGMVQACRRYFAQHCFFAAGVVGSYAMATDSYGRRMHIPLHIEPRGVVEPLEWIIKQL